MDWRSMRKRDGRALPDWRSMRKRDGLAKYAKVSQLGEEKGGRALPDFNGGGTAQTRRRNSQDVEPGVGKRVSYLNREKKLDSFFGQRPVAPVGPKRIIFVWKCGKWKNYAHGHVYIATEGVVKHRRRFHFHEAMLEINEHMHNVWKNQVEEKPMQSSISSWIMNLPFDTKVKEWLAGEEHYKQEVQMNHILPAVADRFLVGQEVGQRGASILYFDEIQEFDKAWYEVTNEYGVVTAESIPVMFGRDYFISARRFITLIDELYNHHCRLIYSAACSIDDLFQGTEEGTLFDLERQVLVSSLSLLCELFWANIKLRPSNLLLNVLLSLLTMPFCVVLLRPLSGLGCPNIDYI
uniref:Uncharacterized protein n=1 Tax=Chenopodium quinoa TaxID=63459 RepID=A0A803MMP3_CHEQI